MCFIVLSWFLICRTNNSSWKLFIQYKILNISSLEAYRIESSFLIDYTDRDWNLFYETNWIWLRMKVIKLKSIPSINLSHFRNNKTINANKTALKSWHTLSAYSYVEQNIFATLIFYNLVFWFVSTYAIEVLFHSIYNFKTSHKNRTFIKIVN